MSNIDLSQLITAEAKATDAATARAMAIKAEVQSRIFAIADQNTQASLLAAVVSGAMSNEEKVSFSVGQAWIEATKAAGRAAVISGDDPVWPDPPADVVSLAEKY